MVYGRYNELVFMGIISWFINQQTSLGGPILQDPAKISRLMPFVNPRILQYLGKFVDILLALLLNRGPTASISLGSSRLSC